MRFLTRNGKIKLELQALLWVVLGKLTFWSVLLVALLYCGSFDRLWTLYWPDGGSEEFKRHFIPYDGSFYINIAENGYTSGTEPCAFYPLWPALIHSFSFLFRDSSIAVALLLANGISIAGWVLFYAFIVRKWGARCAKYSLLFLVAFPGSLFFEFAYSESLFFLLLMALLWAFECNLFFLACGVAFLLPLTRPIGIFCIIPILWHATLVSGTLTLQGTPRSSALSIPSWSASPWYLVLGAAFAALLGWAVYLLIMFLWTSNPFEGFSAQRFWGVHKIANLWNIQKFVTAWLSPSTWHGYVGSFLDRTIFTLILYCMPLAFKLDKALFVWLWVLCVLPAMSGSFTSLTRYASVAFPVFIALGAYFESDRKQGARVTLLAIFFLIQTILVWRYVNFSWAG